MSGVTTDVITHSVCGITDLILGSDFFQAGCFTNLYHQQNEKSYKNYGKALKWTDIATSDMKKFPG